MKPPLKLYDKVMLLCATIDLFSLTIFLQKNAKLTKTKELLLVL